MQATPRGPNWRDPTLVLGGSLVRTVGLLIQLIIIARTCGAELLGIYSFALAITTPLVSTLGWHLRVMLSVDAEHRHAWSAYRQLRTVSLLLGLPAAMAICWCWSTAWIHLGLILLVYAVKSVEAMSELGYGVLQRVGDARAIATGNALRALFVTFGLGVPLLLGASLVQAVAMQSVASLVAYLSIELPRMRGFLERWVDGSSSSVVLLAAAWPLGVAVGLSALGSGMPRLVLTEWNLIADAGALLIVINVLSPVSLAINAMQQSFGARMADAVTQRDQAHWKLYLRQSILVGYLLVAGGGLAAWLAISLLTPLIGWQVDIGLSAFVAVVVAAAIQAHQALLGTGLDSLRQFRMKLVIQVTYVATVSLLCLILVPTSGLTGACQALLVAAAASWCMTWWFARQAAAAVFTKAVPEQE